MKQIEFNWKTKDNIRIYAKEWKIENPKAIVCLVHGFGEHVNRYNHLAKYYNNKGYAVIGYDRRGHGKSEGKRGHTTGYEAFLDEIGQLLVEAETRYPNLPTFLYGHSMGGNLALKYTLDRHPMIRGVVVTGPWIKLPNPPPAALMMIGKLMRSIYPAFTQASDLDPKYVSKNPAVVKAYVDDPLVHGKITSATAIDMVKAADWLSEYTGKMPVPTLIMHATEDHLTSQPASEAFAKQVGGDVTYRKWENVYHEIHNENIQDEVFDYTLKWMDKYLK